MMNQNGPKATGAGTKFRLLMWKNFVQQWRHPVQTVLEVLLPVAAMALVLIIRSQIEPAHRDLTTFEMFPANTLNYSIPVLSGMNEKRMSIAYSPESPILDDVMRSAVATLIRKNIKTLIPIIIEQFPELEPPDIPNEIPDTISEEVILDVIKRFIKVDAYNSSLSLKDIYSTEDLTREVIAGVEFDDELYGATELTGDLKYALRFPERPRLQSFYGQGGPSWQTRLIFPFYETPGPRYPFSSEGGQDPAYVNEMFIALQHVISMELITRITGEDLRSFDVNIQRFPYPPHMEDLVVSYLQYMLPLFIILSFSYTAVNVVRAITVEKELQLKETMKIMGIPTWLHWTAWFCKQFIYLLVIAALIVLLIKINWFTNSQGFSDYSVFTNTHWSVLYFVLMVYSICTIFFCFMLSCFFSKGSTAAVFSGVAWFLSYAPSILLSVDLELSTATQGIICLGINTAMSYGFQMLLAKESSGGMQWGDFLDSTSPDSNRFTFGNVLIMLAIDSVLYLLLALYLEQVMPGPYGVPRPWTFCFHKSYWFPNSTFMPDDLVDIESNDVQNIVMEKDPTIHAIGVQMTDLTKVYGTNVAVNNLSMNIYNDQITVLLGHNGAGKSTTMSMLTGNVKPTSGSVWVAGHDVAQEPAAARAQLGFCPQHNVLFNELTVREHLEFFGRLKGLSGKELEEDISQLITKLELDEKCNYQAGGLSGGQKRRLSVGIALSGAPRVVLLDEPTSGMDPASRRALWNLLQREKIGRSMILTTHFMDEADILGDRVAIMADGRLQCIGSPYFLKRHYGVGYTLVVVKKPGFQREACTDIIKKYVPDMMINTNRSTEVTYALSNDHVHLFEDLLKELESKMDAVQFENYGLTATTLENVFMSVGSDVASAHSDSDDATSSGSMISEDPEKPDFDVSSVDQLHKESLTLTGPRLWLQHVLAVLLKLWLVWTRSWMLVLLQVLVPLVFINATLIIIQYVMNLRETVVPRALSLEKGYWKTETPLTYSGSASSSSLGALATAAYEHMFSSTNNDKMALTLVEDQALDDYYVARTINPVHMGKLRHRMLIGASFAAETATAWFSNFGHHDVATSLAAVHEALLKAYSPHANLSVFNHPLRVQYRDQTSLATLVTILSTQLSSSIGYSLSLVSSVFVMFYVRERVSRAQLLQKAAGIQPVIMWGTAAVFDWAWFIIISVAIVISCAAYSIIGLSSAAELGRMYLVFVIYGFAMLPLHYLMSLFFGGPAIGFVVMFFVNVIFGMLGAQIVGSLSPPVLDSASSMAVTLDSMLQFFPLYSLIRSMTIMNHTGLTEFLCARACDQLSYLLPNLEQCSMKVLCENSFDICCVRENPQFEWEEPGILRYIICMLGSGVAMWALLMFFEYRIHQKIFTCSKNPPPLDRSALDSDVADEITHAQRVDKASLRDHSLVTKGLSKYYGKHLAVNQVSFTVADAEVFGLLGVNGAGKTTTFKMLMGDETISSGDAFVSGHSVKRDITKVHENIGYCPQFDALFGELTGRETLKLFSLLRGRRKHDAAHADQLAHALGFAKHLDKRVEQYSGGNKRKLSTAVALLGQTRLVFVDEPTTGVDPAAKRQLWQAMRSARRAGRGVVLTSHSMEECEALCDRLTIMVNGQFQCLGTPQHLKNKFSEGFTLTIKMKTIDECTVTTLGDRGINAVKHYVETNFVNSKLMEEYQGLLTYYLPDLTVAWSRMFGTMERCRQTHDIEDYTISQTTLEQIFLQFTKYQKEGLRTE